MKAVVRDDMTLDLFEQTDNFMYMIMDSDTYPNGNELNNFGETIDSIVYFFSISK